MSAEAFGLHGNDFRDGFASKQFAGLLQRLTNFSENDAGGPWVGVKFRMDRRTQRVEHLPPPMRATRQAMNRLGRLHDLKFASAMRPQVILNEGTHAQIDGQQAARIDAGLT